MGRPREKGSRRGGPMKRCPERTNKGERCKADVVPGTAMCIAHHRKAKTAATRPQPQMAAGGVENALFPIEVEGYKELAAWLTKECKPIKAGDALAIERLAVSAVQARRYDIAVKSGDKMAGKSLYFANLSVMNWLKVLGLDRRFKLRRQDELGKADRFTKKLGWLFKGRGKEIELERGDGSTTETEPGDAANGPGGIRPGTPEDEPAPEAGGVPQEPVAVQDGTVGAKSG